MPGLEAICPKCQIQYSGGALKYRRNLVCLKCGGVLEMKADKDLKSAGISFSHGGECKIIADQDHWEDISHKTILYNFSRS